MTQQCNSTCRKGALSAAIAWAALAALCVGCGSPAERANASPEATLVKDGLPAAPGPAASRPSVDVPAGTQPVETKAEILPDQRWPQVREGRYIRWVGGVWNTRDPRKLSQAGGVGTLAQRNGTGTCLGEGKVDAGVVEFEVKFDPGYLAPRGGGKHFLEIMSWMADRSDRQAVGKKPWSRIELANLGDRPRCLVWNYGSQFRGQATKIFNIGPAFQADRWYHVRFEWSYRDPTGRVTIRIGGRSYSDSFEFVPGTVGPGRFFLFGHVETDKADGCLHFRDFKGSLP